MRKQNRYLNLVSYFGGKYPHLKWLINLFPAGNYHFIDIMCGGLNVSLNVNYPHITVNDINDEMINLLYVLREHPEEFLRKLYFTPFSRKELEIIVNDSRNEIVINDKIEQARRYFVKCQLGYGANGSQNNHHGFGAEYRIQKSNYYRVDNFNLKLIRLIKIIDKIKTFQIENKDCFELFEKVNRKGNIVYFDPPYVLSERKSKKRYLHEVEDDFHIKLSAAVKNANCYVAVSGYDSPLYREIFSDFFISKNKVTKSNVGKIEVTECLYTNYDPQLVNGILKLNLTCNY